MEQVKRKKSDGSHASSRKNMTRMKQNKKSSGEGEKGRERAEGGEGN